MLSLILPGSAVKRLFSLKVEEKGYLTFLGNSLAFFFRFFFNHLSNHLGLKKFSIV
jgi:hypothetical protein